MDNSLNDANLEIINSWRPTKTESLAAYEEPTNVVDQLFEVNRDYLDQLQTAQISMELVFAEVETLSGLDPESALYRSLEPKAHKKFMAAEEIFSATINSDSTPQIDKALLAIKAQPLWLTELDTSAIVEDYLCQGESSIEKARFAVEAKEIIGEQRTKNIVENFLLSNAINSLDSLPEEPIIDDLAKARENDLARAELAIQSADVIGQDMATAVVESILSSKRLGAINKALLAVEASELLPRENVEDRVNHILTAELDDVNTMQKATVALASRKFITKKATQRHLNSALSSDSLDVWSKTTLAIDGSDFLKPKQVEHYVNGMLKSDYFSSYGKAEVALMAMPIIGTRQALAEMENALGQDSWDSTFKSELLMRAFFALIEHKKQEDTDWINSPASDQT